MKKFAMIGILLLVVALAACQEKESVEEVPDSPPPTEQQEEHEEEGQEEVPSHPYQAPLTGEGLNEELTHPIIGVMIDNHSAARPQSGLGQADIVYEVLAEGFITRYLALFHSQQPELIGPVRSLRSYYLDIALGYQAIIAHAGGSPEAKDRVAREHVSSLDGLSYSESAFYRANDRYAPHNLYTTWLDLAEAAERRNYGTGLSYPSFAFKGEDEEPEGEQIASVTLAYHTSYQVEYRFDPVQQIYDRYINGEPHRDRETGAMISTTNLLVLEIPHRIMDDKGRRVVDVKGEGKGYLLQRGSMLEVSWSQTDGIIRAYHQGVEVELYPGKTWINIMPEQLTGDQQILFN